MYVYQITNLINNKKYIGITNNLERRWGSECSYPSNPKKRQKIQIAIHKYGKENFEFKCLYKGLSIEEASEKEKQLIKELNTRVPNGYNVALGGIIPTYGARLSGDEVGTSCLTYEEAKYIKEHRDIPIYLLYENYNNKISYEAFKRCYYNETYKNIEPTVDPYPYNLEFTSQFITGLLNYEQVVNLRIRYSNGEWWKDVYEDYKDIYKDPLTFWNIYYGNRYKLVMPEVFTKENRHYHAGLSKSGELNGKAKLTEAQVRDIRNKWENGYTRAQLYKLYPFVNTSTIRNIINYKTWKNLK